MWLGEQITERGVGNGVSLIITIGIVARLPNAFTALHDMFSGKESNYHLMGTGVMLVLLLAMVIGGVIAVTQHSGKSPSNTRNAPWDANFIPAARRSCRCA